MAERAVSLVQGDQYGKVAGGHGRAIVGVAQTVRVTSGSLASFGCGSGSDEVTNATSRGRIDGGHPVRRILIQLADLGGLLALGRHCLLQIDGNALWRGVSITNGLKGLRKSESELIFDLFVNLVYEGVIKVNYCPLESIGDVFRDKRSQFECGIGNLELDRDIGREKNGLPFGASQTRNHRFRNVAFDQSSPQSGSFGNAKASRTGNADGLLIEEVVHFWHSFHHWTCVFADPWLTTNGAVRGEGAITSDASWVASKACFGLNVAVCASGASQTTFSTRVRRVGNSGEQISLSRTSQALVFASSIARQAGERAFQASVTVLERSIWAR